MAIHPGPLLQLVNLVPGDILVEYDDTPDHSLMWVGGTKPIVHSAEAQTSGILRQSARGMGGNGPACHEVYRANSPTLAQYAVAIACKWAVASDDPRYVLFKTDERLQEFALNLMTRFSQDRLGGDGGLWSNREPFVRAVRAYCRSYTGEPLSAGEGVTCSQFISYTYQAASISRLAHLHAHTRVVVQEAIARQVVANLHSAQAYAAAVASLRPIYNSVNETMPAPFKVDAKITSVDRLTLDLRTKPGFAHVGNLGSPDDDSD